LNKHAVGGGLQKPGSWTARQQDVRREAGIPRKRVQQRQRGGLAVALLMGMHGARHGSVEEEEE